jgi:hypothetical protein
MSNIVKRGGDLSLVEREMLKDCYLPMAGYKFFADNYISLRT